MSGFAANLAEEHEAWLADLDFAPTLARTMGAVLGQLSCECQEEAHAKQDTSGLGSAVMDRTAQTWSDDLLIIYVVSHGRAHPGALYVLGSDGACYPAAEVDHWVKTIYNTPGALLTCRTQISVLL